jgi:hypothetical protein
VLRQALACAERGWPVFPCQPGRKAPATGHGYLDATTEPAQIREWFARQPGRNLAVATGAPGPDVLDIDTRGPAASGFPALARLRAAGLLDGAGRQVRTPGGGLHLYFAGSDQRSGHLPASHLDFLSGGGYVLIPPSQVGGRPYQHVQILGGHGALDWDAAVRLLEPHRLGAAAPGPDAGGAAASVTEPSRQDERPASPQSRGEPSRDSPGPASRLPAADLISALARWVAAQPEGNRNAGLFWAANRALETGQAADLSPLAAAARQAGLTDPEITRTLSSARRTTQAPPEPPSHQAEGI